MWWLCSNSGDRIGKKMSDFHTLTTKSMWNVTTHNKVTATRRYRSMIAIKSCRSVSLAHTVIFQINCTVVVSTLFVSYFLCDTLMNWQTKWPIGHLYFTTTFLTALNIAKFFKSYSQFILRSLTNTHTLPIKPHAYNVWVCMLNTHKKKRNKNKWEMGKHLQWNRQINHQN